MASIIKTVQAQIEARVEELVADSSVVVMSRLRGHVANNVAAAVNTNKIVVLCLPPAIGGIKPNVFSRCVADDCKMRLRIIERPTTNPTKTNAYELVEKILSINGHKTAYGVQVFVARAESADPDDENFVEFELELKMTLEFPRTETL